MAINKQALWASSSPVASEMFLRVDDFDTAYQRMVAAGVQVVSPPHDEPSGRLAVFLDHEGNRWDLLGRDPPAIGQPATAGTRSGRSA
jgi:predicted enzyme related to lactoylglutathione lyase